jgi:ABC-type sugar transport system ATPase subunit
VTLAAPPRVPRLVLENVSKSFGSIRALSGVSFDVLPGEVHVIAGENGAGKSTLIKILSGVYQDYQGDILVDGEKRRFRSPAEATSAGIATIHQELSLVGSLSAIDNLLFGTGESAFAPISRRTARERAEKLLSQMELSIDPDAPVETLSFAERQLLEIARALGRNAQVLVMDEPTSALAEPQAERLFSHIERLVDAGTSIVYISHRLEEMYRLARRITVLRDGRHVLTRPSPELGHKELIEAMVGRAAREPAARPTVSSPGPALFEARDFGGPEGRFRGVSFELRKGEILGVAGLQGSGTSALCHALFGSAVSAGGSLFVDGKPHVPSSPAASLERGVALVPGDRGVSVLAELAVLENATLSSLARYSPRGVLNRKLERDDTGREGARISLRAPSLDAPARALSGGNQQKLALLRCLLTRPKVLLLDDPTRGVDLGAKAEIHEHFRELARGGMGLLFHSTELDELLAVCQRVIVFNRGEIVATLSGGELSRERVLAHMLGAAA